MEQHSYTTNIYTFALIYLISREACSPHSLKRLAFILPSCASIVALNIMSNFSAGRFSQDFANLLVHVSQALRTALRFIAIHDVRCGHFRTPVEAKVVVLGVKRPPLSLRLRLTLPQFKASIGRLSYWKTRTTTDRKHSAWLDSQSVTQFEYNRLQALLEGGVFEEDPSIQTP
jgi:hypothetical protein